MVVARSAPEGAEEYRAAVDASTSKLRSYGFLIGDGALNYGAEVLGELFYRAALDEHVSLGVNYQPLFNPAYNRDRGPVHIFTARAHVAF